MRRGGFTVYGKPGTCVVRLNQASGAAGIRNGAVVRPLDVTSPGLGERLVALLEEAQELGPVTREESLEGVAALEGLLGKRATNLSSAARVWPVVTVTCWGDRTSVMTQLAPASPELGGEPQENLPEPVTADVLEEAFRRYWDMAESHLIGLGKYKQEPTFPGACA